MSTITCLRWAAAVITALGVVLAGTWGTCALWYQVSHQWLKAACTTGWGVLMLGALIGTVHGRAPWSLGAFFLAFACLLIWWQRIAPSNERNWADDVAQMTTGSIEGNRVILRNVRNFDWRSTADYTQRWETRTFDLDRLNCVDMIMSYWSGSSIAHMLVSFGFGEGCHVVFSVEVRRERDETFSEIGGFFKQFELSVIAADERDVVRLRTNVRGEDDYLYRLQMPVKDMRALLIGYIGEANALVESPRFYNTVTVNCTTLVYHMMKRIAGSLPLDYRLLLSGHLPEYVYPVGGLDRRYGLEELRNRGRITDRARLSDRSDSFSADIRRGVPGIND